MSTEVSFVIPGICSKLVLTSTKFFGNPSAKFRDISQNTAEFREYTTQNSEIKTRVLPEVGMR